MKIHVVSPILFAIIISIILAQLIIFVNSFQNESLFTLQESFNISTISNLFFVSISSLIILFGLFRISKLRSLTIAKFLVFLFIEGGMLSILLFGKLLFTILGLDTPLFLIFFGTIAYICTFLGFRTFFDSLSLKMRNRLFIISSGSIGSFLGLLIPIIPIVVFSVILSLIDLLLIQSNFFQKRLGSIEHEAFIIEMAFSTSDWGIGIGDLICYSMIVSSASVNFGLIIGGLSLIFVLIGSIYTMKLTSKEKHNPGLPLASILGLLPSVICIIL